MVYLPSEVIENIFSFLGGEKYNIKLNKKKMMKLVIKRTLDIRRIMVNDVIKTMTGKMHYHLSKKIHEINTLDAFTCAKEMKFKIDIYLPTHQTVHREPLTLYTFTILFDSVKTTPIRGVTDDLYEFFVEITKNEGKRFSFNKKIVNNKLILNKLKSYENNICTFSKITNQISINDKNLNVGDSQFLDELYTVVYYYIYAFYINML